MGAPCVLGLLGFRRRTGTGLPGETTEARPGAATVHDPFVDHLAPAVSDQYRSQRFYEAYLGFDAAPARRCDPDGYVVEVSWEPD